MGSQDTAADPAVESRWDRARGILREITAGGLAGLVAGVLVGGVGGRVVMRVSSLVAPSSSIGRTTDSGFRVGEVTLGGSIELLSFVGLFSGLIGGIFLVMVWPWVSAWGRWRAIGVGGFVLAAGSASAIDPHNIDFFILGNRAFLVALFVALFFAWAFAAVMVRDVLDRVLPDRSRGSTVAYSVVALMGLPFAVAFPSLLFDSGSDTPLAVSVSVMFVAVATLALWVIRVWDIADSVNRVVRWIGYGGYAGTLVFGLTQAASDAMDIVTRFGRG
jgi:hypothetical protein